MIDHMFTSKQNKTSSFSVKVLSFCDIYIHLTLPLFTQSEDDECTRRNVSALCYLLEINMFKAVLYFLLKFITNTAVPQSFMKF